MTEGKLDITASVLRAENKYLTWVIAFFVTVLVGTLGVIGNFQIKATNTNTEELKLLRGDIGIMNIATNDRINQLYNRLDVGREKATSAYKMLQSNVERNKEDGERNKEDVARNKEDIANIKEQLKVRGYE